MPKTVQVSAAEVAGFPAGRGTCAKLGGVAVIVFKGADGALKIAPNVCAHMSAGFAADVEDAALLKCSMHGAKLDPSTMAYVTPPALMAGMGGKVAKGTAQPQFAVTANADGSASFEVPDGKGCELA